MSLADSAAVSLPRPTKGAPRHTRPQETLRLYPSRQLLLLREEEEEEEEEEKEEEEEEEDPYW